jgi:hypothetical protein
MKPQAPDLSKLHDFVQPPPPSWIPHTIGWYVLLALLAAAILFFAVRALHRWWKNRYRRDALREIYAAPLTELSEILKRTALITWPREKVASLTGQQWLDFLADSSSLDAFRDAPGDRIEKTALTNPSLDANAQQRLRQLASYWVQKHHA